MNNKSVNGILEPIGDFTGIENPYLGHFLKVSYTREIHGQPVFSKDRVDVQGNGSFRFFIPAKDELLDERVIIEVFGADGSMAYRQSYSYGSLQASDAGITSEDDSEPLVIRVDPLLIGDGTTSPIEQSLKKVSGKIIDLSGERKACGLEVIIMVTDDAANAFDVASYQPVLSARTDSNGYFFGKVENRTVARAFGVIAGADSEATEIQLEDGKLPGNILLVTDLSTLPEDLASNCADSIPSLPDSEDLVNSGAFSQDVGGKCVDFTIPNRTLEEFSFYQTVRTTEPEIRGLTINSKDSREIIRQVDSISTSAFSVLGRLNSSFSSLSVKSYSVVEEASPKMAEANQRSVEDQPSVAARNPNYLFRLDIGGNQHFDIRSSELLKQSPRLVYLDILRLAAERLRRRNRLMELHAKLAAAYCGIQGIESTETFCERLINQDQLNRDEIRANMGHLRKNREGLDGMSPALSRQFDQALLNLEKLVARDRIDRKSLTAMEKELEKLIEAIDKNTAESSQQEQVLHYLRRVIIELARAGESSPLGFEPCPPGEKTPTMGIMCLINKFNEIRDKLNNATILSLGEIIEIEEYYRIFLESLSTFLPLLDEYYNFYRNSPAVAIDLIDDYFYTEHDQIKSTLMRLRMQIQRALARIQSIRKAYIRNHPGRVSLTVENSVDWDETPTIYENTTIAHGHILHLKQKWKADGYSLGDLLYSLPLAPCQEKQIAILDWDRKEKGSRDASSLSIDQLEAELSRDRDISEIIASSLTESMRASSSNETSSTSAGIGAGVGGFISGVLFGVAGGVAHSGASSSSSASQNSSRNLAASSLSSLRDNVTQSASSLRSQRSTVIQTVDQSEDLNIQTEVIKNNNHCHAMTVEYFEVLKHYALEQELVDVQECLFVPMPMGHFDHDKILRWKNTLSRAIHGRLLRRGFGAIERIENDYANSDFPDGPYSEEVIEEYSGHFTISFELQRPYIKEIDEATKTEEYDLSIPFPWFLGRMVFHLEREVPLTEAEKDAIFEAQYAPDIVRTFIDTLHVYAVAEDGTEEDLALDLTLLSNYRRGVPLRVSIASGSLGGMTRSRIKHLRFRAATEVTASSRIILRSVYLHYRTTHLGEYILRNNRINNDVINVSEAPGLGTVTDTALIYTPMNRRELSNPKKEDQEAASALVDFLNENMEMAHKVIWSSIDSSRLFGLLDGYIAPNANGRSVASVVENRVSGIVGNNLVLKVVPGERLDPVFRHVEDLLAYYQPTTKPDPFRISVPTKGVYAEAVMGRCNSCEVIDESRHWRFTEQPCGTQPTAIETISGSSRRSEPPELKPDALPASIISLQNAPAAPDPAGLGTALGVLGSDNLFKDITGLEGTQANALGALKTTAKSVTDLASISKDFANLAVMNNAKKDGSKQIEQIKKLNKDGYLDNDETRKQIKKVLDSYNNAASSVSKKSPDPKESVARKIAEKAISSGLNASGKNVEFTRVSADGDTESIKISKPSDDDVSLKPRLFLSGSSASPEVRAFHPATRDASLVIEVSAGFSDAPDGAHIRWEAEDPAALVIDNPDAAHTRVRGVKPGKQNLKLKLLDDGGNEIDRITLKLSVPQCVIIEENKPEFDKMLQDAEIDSVKAEVIQEIRQVAEQLLRTANVRLFWQLEGLDETPPDHVPERFVISSTIENVDPANPGRVGVTFAADDAEGFNERISLYPGAYSLPNAIDVDTETQALIIQLESDLPGNDELRPLAARIFGRLIGETLSHEIGHALLWDDIPTGHNSPAIPNDLMNRGVDRLFRQRTGMENTAQISPVEPDHYLDHGINAIGGFQALNQSRLDRHLPVPPAFG